MPPRLDRDAVHRERDPVCKESRTRATNQTDLRCAGHLPHARLLEIAGPAARRAEWMLDFGSL